MAATIQTAWVAPPLPISGQDHLSIRAPCEAIYTQLLPGITNVTERARCYSFYPWLVWSIEARYADRSRASQVRIVRRAECLLTLLGQRHASTHGEEEDTESDEGLHAGGLVGLRTLRRVDPDAPEGIDLETYTTKEESPTRYFKNPLGAFGQYYFGPLRDLRVVDLVEDTGSTGKQPVGYDKERGQKLAEAFEQGVPGDRFFQVLEADRVFAHDLDDLAGFCPCGLLTSHAEREQLLDLFLARTPAFQSKQDQERRRTLGLLLELLAQGAHDARMSFEGLLRVAAYARVVPGGGSWGATKRFAQVFQGWGVYQRNELLSVAVQGLFASVLGTIARDHEGKLRSTTLAGDIARGLAGLADLDLAASLSATVAGLATTLPSLEDWENEAHELQLGWSIPRLTRDQEASWAEVAGSSIRLLLALLARGLEADPYAGLEQPPDTDPADINLLTLRLHLESTWKPMSVGDWVAWLATRWGVSRHLSVALRKLRAERRDTFQLRPLEQGFEVVGVPPPTFTTPRVGRAFRMLRDLGLIAGEESKFTLTQDGLRELEAIRVG